jgi:PAS domain S-box-containing protein
VERNEAYQAINSLYFLLLVKALITIGIAILLGFFFSKILTRPIVNLKKAFDKIQQGDLPESIPIESQDEIGEIAKTVNSHVEVLKHTAAFARSIGERNFDFDFKPISEKDSLGKALVEMKERLQEVEEKDTSHSWIVTGVAELASVLRAHDKITPLADGVCKYLYQRLNARQVCIYLIDKENSSQINLRSAYAYGKKKFLEKTYKIGENIVGDTAFEKTTIYKTEIKEDYDFISSGLKDESIPSSVISVPLITNEELFGILEINSDLILQEKEINYVEQVSDIIAQTVFSINVNDQTKNLLDEIQHAQTRLQALLENSSEIITIADKEGTILYVSPSVEPILGYKANDLIGTKDSNRLDGAYIDKFDSFFDKLANSKKPSKEIEIVYKKKNGDKIWIEAVGMNMLNDPAIRGLVVNYRDITTRKLD